MYYLIALAIVLLDQVTKWFVVKNMDIGGNIPVWEGVFSITSHRNQGAAFGILQGQTWLFYIITLVVVAGIVFYLQKYGRKEFWLGLSLAIILGGAIGNFIDRVFRNGVVDFLYFRLIDFPIFNVADAALTVGVAIMFIYTLIEGKKERHEQKQQANR